MNFEKVLSRFGRYQLVYNVTLMETGGHEKVALGGCYWNELIIWGGGFFDEQILNGGFFQKRHFGIFNGFFAILKKTGIILRMR